MSLRKVLSDECVDRGLVERITDHEVRTVPEAGWASLKNGELLGRAKAEYDVFITTDRNLMFQQNLPHFDIAVIVLAAKTNRLDDLVVLLPKLLESIPSAKPGGPLVLERYFSGVAFRLSPAGDSSAV